MNNNQWHIDKAIHYCNGVENIFRNLIVSELEQFRQLERLDEVYKRLEEFGASGEELERWKRCHDIVKENRGCKSARVKKKLESTAPEMFKMLEEICGWMQVYGYTHDLYDKVYKLVKDVKEME